MPAPTSAAEPASKAPGASPVSVAPLRAAALFAVAAHLLARLWLVHADRFFTCEDDAYRAYTAYLIGRGESVIGRFWLPGHMLAMAGVQRLGVPVLWSGILVCTLSVAGLAAALAYVVRALAPADLREAAPWAALLVIAASPMTLILGHSSLAEPLECALIMAAAAAALRRARGGPLWILALGVLALLAATWVRYESWTVALALPGVLYLARRRGGARPLVALGEAALGALPLLGPIAWMWCQAVKYGDPFAFVERADDLSQTMMGEASSLLVLTDRAKWLALWAPATLAWAALAAFWLRDRRGAGARWFALIASLGILVEIGTGREHGIFTARLGYSVEVALWPLAALGVAWAFTRARKLAAVAALAAAAATVAVLAVGIALPPEILDPSSITAGLMLRRGELDATLGKGSLLVERLPRRPPFGWAALGVLWGRWDRTQWGMLRHDGWQLVAPTEVRGGRRGMPSAELPAWLDQHQITAAWLLSVEAVEELQVAWPHARVRAIGDGRLVTRQ